MFNKIFRRDDYSPIVNRSTVVRFDNEVHQIEIHELDVLSTSSQQEISVRRNDPNRERRRRSSSFRLIYLTGLIILTVLIATSGVTSIVWNLPTKINDSIQNETKNTEMNSNFDQGNV